MNLIQRVSPNFTRGRGGLIPDALVMHTTGNTTQSGTNTVLNGNSGVSYHFIITGADFAGHGIVPSLKDGDVIQFVDIADTAWHSGITAIVRNSGVFRNKAHQVVQKRPQSPNSYTIGIGFGDMNRNNWGLTQAQIASAVSLILHIQSEVMQRFNYSIPLTREHIIGHNQVDPVNRPNCPGPRFPFDEIIENLLREEHENMKRYQSLAEIRKDHSWAVEELQALIDNGVLQGNEGGGKGLDLTIDMIRSIIMSARMVNQKIGRG